MGEIDMVGYYIKMKIYLASICILFGISMGCSVYAATSIDSDADGVSDTIEKLFGTDPHKIDTDGDGYPDGIEISAGFSPTNTRPIRLEKHIVIRISKQQLEKQLGGIALETFPVSTGIKPYSTPLGTFTIKNKSKRAWSDIGKLWMPWWMQFTYVNVPTKGLKTVGIHELPEWPDGRKEGANNLGHPASHGCVRLGVGPAKNVYEWAPMGTKVTVLQ